MNDERNQKKPAPKAVIKRLALYSRALHRMEMNEETRVSSQALSERLGLNPAQVRKDLAYFGQFGVPGFGYHIKDLRLEIRRILGMDREVRVAIVGVGNLGRALLSYVGFRNQGFRFIGVFDADPKKIGSSVNELQVHPVSEMEEFIRRERVELVILSVPAAVAQETTDRIVGCGISAILNFVPLRLKVPDHVRVHYVDLAMELESLSYYLK